MKQPWNTKQYISTLFFGLLLNTSLAGNGKTYHFTGVWDGNSVQIINPQVVNKNKFCIHKMYINGVKIKGKFKSGGIELDLSDYGFTKDDDLLITMECKSDCNPSFHSEGFILQQD
jgi:hypothetical protein